VSCHAKQCKGNAKAMQHNAKNKATFDLSWNSRPVATDEHSLHQWAIGFLNRTPPIRASRLFS